jgi:shikimate kinase
VHVAWDRIKKAGDLPPFLKGDNPEETHRQLHERRNMSYRDMAVFASQFCCIKVENKTPHEIAHEIEALLRGT